MLPIKHLNVTSWTRHCYFITSLCHTISPFDDEQFLVCGGTFQFHRLLLDRPRVDQGRGEHRKLLHRYAHVTVGV